MKLINRCIVASIFLPAILLAFFPACSAGKAVTPVPVDLMPTFSHSGKQTLSDRWWTSFGDHSLNHLVDSALQINLDLQTPWQRLKQHRQ